MSVLSVDTRWRSDLYQRLRGQADPLFVLPDCTIPAASLWVSVRLWVDLFRRSGLQPGDRVVLATEPSVGSLAFLLAGLWEQLTIAIALPYRGVPDVLEAFDARLGLGCGGLDADAPGCPVVSQQWALRKAIGPCTPEARLITRTSGTGGSPTWVVLSDDNIWSVIDSHREHVAQQGDIVLSILPWHHSFGLIIDLLPALFNAGMIIREASGGRDPRSIIACANHWGATYCSLVPLQAQRIAELPEGLDFIRSLRGGVVGGAPAVGSTVDVLSSSRLRVGYGQTEASPGICLGRPGEWTAGFIGRPVGCTVRIGDEGRLLVQGPNVCMGVWANERVWRLNQNRWLDTGDVVESHRGALTYIGRADNNFKLGNGRMVDAIGIERDLRSEIPAVEDAMIYSPNGESLHLCLVFKSAGVEPDIHAIRRVLGSLADRVTHVTARLDSSSIRTSKGSLDRLGLAAA